MTSELALKQDQLLSELKGAYGDLPQVTANDIVIPRLLLMQPGSPDVKDRHSDIKFGDVVDTVNKDVIGSVDEPINVLPIHCERYWLSYVLSDSDEKNEFYEKKEWTPENDNLPRVQVVDGKEIQNFRAYGFYVLLERELKEFLGRMKKEYGDLNKYASELLAGRAPQGPIPYQVVFKSTSQQAGMNMFKHMYVTNPGIKKAPCGTLAKLKVAEVERDGNSWIQYEWKNDRDAEAVELALALSWLRKIKGGHTTVEPDPEETKQEDQKTDDLPF